MDTITRDLLPEGLEDRLPHAAAMAARVTRSVLDCLDAHGYDRVQPPGLEFEASLASSMAGIETRRMFRFVDPASLRTLALRSDMTPQVGRIAATRLAAAARPLRLVAGHHPLIDADTRSTGSTRGGRAALAALAAAGAQAVLSGHVHDPFDRTVHAGGHSIRLIGAGTLSERLRSTPPSYNRLEWSAEARLTVKVVTLA